MKKDNFKVIFLLTVIITVMGLSSFLCSVIVSGEKNQRPVEDMYIRPFSRLMNETFLTDDFSSIKINSNYSDIKMVNTRLLKDKVRVVVTGTEKDTVSAECRNNILQIVCNENLQAQYPSSPETVITVYMPMNFDTQADIKTLCGDISLGDMHGEINVFTGLGDIEISQVNISQNSVVSTQQGDVKINMVNDVRIEISASGGAIETPQHNTDSGITLAVSTQSGNIEIND